MCGISGHFLLQASGVLDLPHYYQSHQLLKHRGPDDEGFLVQKGSGEWASLRGNDTVSALSSQLHCLEYREPVRAVMGHRRLSIIDLSPQGHQPMGDAESGVWVVFNGEIYNYIELRRDLEAKGFRFHSHSDTEVLLKAYLAWGRSFVERLDGMWAFALNDTRKQELVLSRDRAGMKPLYYYSDTSRFLFGSEMRFLNRERAISTINETAAFQYLQDSLLEDKRDTMYVNIYQLRPSELMVLHYPSGVIERTTYWDPLQMKRENAMRPVSAEQLLSTLQHSIDIHLRGDVPLGVTLSGGIDSAAIAVLANPSFENTNNPLRTFSIVFPEKEYSERHLIEQTLRQLHSQHTWVEPDRDTFSDQITRVLQAQEIPIRSLAVISQNILMRAVSEKGIKVILGGQGADELFGGYSYYNSFLAAEWLRRWNVGQAWKEYQSAIPRSSCTLWRMGAALRNHWMPAENSLRPHALLDTPHSDISSKTEPLSGDLFWNALYQDFFHRALPEYLHYEDRNSMAASIESRLPFLGKELLEMGFQMPLDQKISNGVRKSLLRQALKGRIPEAIRQDRIKKGFISPQEVWQRTSLKSMFDRYFLSDELKYVPLLKTEAVRKYYQAYVEGRHNELSVIWRIFCFGTWYKQIK